MNSYYLKDKSELLNNAGLFMIGIKQVMDLHFDQENNDNGTPLKQNALYNLMLGLELAGTRLVCEAEEMAEQIEEETTR
ncbi:hypothetical protein ADIMK_2655 [Marinobacterium lacunae]|uniref:Uncharacterized protein n=1 Tax=Marinobacterium lacunae TaxID=1232683 RepID=A0A081FX76_9GAMM|nr:hypothetical protein [Marinobacterium lacunae]KEA63131.1 hypothetical protein ADIMK_2655 [Marinobacterium lacunae]